MPAGHSYVSKTVEGHGASAALSAATTAPDSHAHIHPQKKPLARAESRQNRKPRNEQCAAARIPIRGKKHRPFEQREIVRPSPLPYMLPIDPPASSRPPEFRAVRVISRIKTSKSYVCKNSNTPLRPYFKGHYHSFRAFRVT